MDDLLACMAAKKAELDRLGRDLRRSVANFNHSQDLELTYTSNAIEGNTLTAVETTMVIEQGITIAGKPLRDHLEALDHYDAIRYVRELARASGASTQMDIRNLHRLVMLRSNPEIAGQYADQGRYVLTDKGRHAFPTPAEVHPLMEVFAAWLAVAPMTPETAFTAHRRLVDIPPFNDGNGRTARLLMNLVLIRGGHPPVPVRPEDHPRYIAALNLAQDGGGDGAFRTLLYERLDATLDEVLQAFGQARPDD